MQIGINMCLSLGDTLDEAIRNIQTAVELYYDGENITVPPQASKIEDLVTSDL
jgi:predicted RNase H-like HicB family nuclease